MRQKPPVQKRRGGGRREDDSERRPGELLVQPGQLADSEFDVGLERGEIDTLGGRTRYGEVTLIVWHRLGMPEYG